MEPENIFKKINIIRRISTWIAERLVDWAGKQLGEKWYMKFLESGDLIAVTRSDTGEIIAVADQSEEFQRLGTIIKVVGVIPGREVFVEFGDEVKEDSRFVG